MDVATRLIELGRRAEALQLVNEVLKDRKAAEVENGRAARRAIGNLARLDLKSALTSIPDGGERTTNDLRGRIAQDIADVNPAEAERLIGQMTWDSSEAYVVRACRRMARVDLPRARKIASAIKSDVLRGYALGTMAGSLAPGDRATARQLLADSFESFKRAVEGGRGGVWGGQAAGPMAAALLPIVERVDPDRLAESIQRVLALRWFPRSIRDLTMTSPDTSDAEVLRYGAALAALVSRYDHDLARALAQPVLAAFRAPLSKDIDRFLDRYAVLPALALAEPRGTAALAEIIPDLKEEGVGQSRDMVRYIIARALSAPKAEFWPIIHRCVLDLELVERED
jgi:hypothetical protein